MKSKAQIISAILFVLSFIKSFSYSNNVYDIFFILICASVYLVYEFIINNKTKKQLEDLIQDNEKRFNNLDKEMKETKGYVSTMSLSSTYNRK